MTDGSRPPAAYRPGPRDTLMHALARSVESQPDAEFANIAGEIVTFAEIDRRANAFARSLAGLGVAKGDRVVSLLDTSMDVLVVWFGITKLGAIWVPINNAYRGEFLRHQISDAGAHIAISDPQYLDRFVELADKLPDIRMILCRDAGPFPDCRITIEPMERYKAGDTSPLPIVVEPSDLAALLYTSGTTGPSKGCMISHNYMCMQGRQHIRAVPVTRDDVYYTPLPLFHSAALNVILGALINGMRVAIWPRFSLSTFWEDIEASGATNGMFLASIFSLVAHGPDTEAMKRCYGKLSMIYGQPITPEVRKIWKERFGVKIVSSWAYGQTEASRLCMALPHEEPPETCAGRVSDEFEMIIADDDDQPLPDGTVGNIIYRPREPNVMFEGYWRRPEDTAKAQRNLWMHSGDLGRVENGWFFFADRAKDYLRARGENISSFEIERVYLSHPAIAEVAVHATGAQDAEDEIKVTAVLREAVSLTEHDLCLWAIDQLPHFAVPRFIEFRAELVKNPTGRVLKYKLRDEGVTPATWDREAAGIVVRRKR